MNEETMFVALYFDADVDRKLTEQLRAKGYELSDEEQLAYAVAQKRALLTHNVRHFVPMFNEWWNAGKSHYGIIVSEQLPIGEMLRRTLKLLNTVIAYEMMNNVKNLAEFAEQT